MIDFSKYKELRYFVYYVGACVLLSIILLLIEGIPLLRTLQAGFGIAYVLFLPGYVFVILLYNKKGLDGVERLALSFALSIALVTLTIILTNTLFKIPITPLSNFLIILFLILIIILFKIIVNNINQKKK